MNDPFPTSKLGYPRRPLERPLRPPSRNRLMEDKKFRVDDQGASKVLRDCTEAAFNEPLGSWAPG